MLKWYLTKIGVKYVKQILLHKVYTQDKKTTQQQNQLYCKVKMDKSNNTLIEMYFESIGRV